MLIPGSHRPGLIEARTFSALLGPFGRQFRGLIAPASLKPGALPPLGRLGVEFRGLIAPASLKQRIPHLRPMLAAHNSGVSSPRPH